DRKRIRIAYCLGFTDKFPQAGIIQTLKGNVVQEIIRDQRRHVTRTVPEEYAVQRIRQLLVSCSQSAERRGIAEHRRLERIHAGNTEDRHTVRSDSGSVNVYARYMKFNHRFF